MPMHEPPTSGIRPLGWAPDRSACAGEGGSTEGGCRRGGDWRWGRARARHAAPLALESERRREQIDRFEARCAAGPPLQILDAAHAHARAGGQDLLRQPRRPPVPREECAEARVLPRAAPSQVAATGRTSEYRLEDSMARVGAATGLSGLPDSRSRRQSVGRARMPACMSASGHAPAHAPLIPSRPYGAGGVGVGAIGRYDVLCFLPLCTFGTVFAFTCPATTWKLGAAAPTSSATQPSRPDTADGSSTVPSGALGATRNRSPASP